MKKLFSLLLLLFSVTAPAFANTQPAIVFSQEIVAIAEDGSLLPTVEIKPESMTGMQTLDFDLGRERLLRIQTNISDTEERGLSDLVATVKRCYQYLETITGRTLDRDVMLYLIELDKIPFAYTFRATYNDANQWSEVRLALIEHGTMLSGPHASTSLTDLLYDTLPHELGHDLLSSLPQLMHDIDGEASNHTRWFIEGVCEVLAKGFSRREVPSLHRNFIALRNVGTVLAETQGRRDLLNWAQDNSNGMVLESDFYGASMLTIMEWTKSISLTELFTELATCNRQICGLDLIDIMHRTTGFGPDEILRRAHNHGRQLDEQVVLTHLLLNKG